MEFLVIALHTSIAHYSAKKPLKIRQMEHANCSKRTL